MDLATEEIEQYLREKESFSLQAKIKKKQKLTAKVIEGFSFKPEKIVD